MCNFVRNNRNKYITMSDGNFNRNLLPYRDYQSGLRAGQATMRQRALNAAAALLDEAAPALSPDRRQSLLDEFKQALL